MNANITKIFINGFHRVMFNRMAPRITCIASFEHLHSYIHRSSQEGVQRLRFVVYVTDVYPYPPRSVHWRGTILQVSASANQSWVIGVNFVFTNPHRTDNITTTKQSTKKPRWYLMGYIRMAFASQAFSNANYRILIQISPKVDF